MFSYFPLEKKRLGRLLQRLWPVELQLSDFVPLVRLQFFATKNMDIKQHHFRFLIWQMESSGSFQKSAEGDYGKQSVGSLP